MAIIFLNFDFSGEYGNSNYPIIKFQMFQNVGVHFETWNAGVLGPVTLKGLNEGSRDLSKQKWSYKVC